MPTGDDGVTQPNLGRRGAITTTVVFRLAALLLGLFIGRSIAYQVSRGGLEGAIGGGLWVYGTLLALVTLFVAVAIRARIRRGPVGATLRPVVIGSAFLAAGALVGNVSAPYTGGLYRNALVLQTTGTMTLRMDDVPTFEGIEGSPVTCSSLPDGLDAAEVTGLDLGLLGARHLRGTVSLPFGNEAAARLDLWLDGADLPEGAFQPTWSGPLTVTVLTRAGEDRPGQATFDSVALLHDPKLPAPSEAFPEMFAGSLEWSCGLFQPA